MKGVEKSYDVIHSVSVFDPFHFNIVYERNLLKRLFEGYDTEYVLFFLSSLSVRTQNLKKSTINRKKKTKTNLKLPRKLKKETATTSCIVFYHNVSKRGHAALNCEYTYYQKPHEKQIKLIKPDCCKKLLECADVHIFLYVHKVGLFLNLDRGFFQAE